MNDQVVLNLFCLEFWDWFQIFKVLYILNVQIKLQIQVMLKMVLLIKL